MRFREVRGVSAGPAPKVMRSMRLKDSLEAERRMRGELEAVRRGRRARWRCGGAGLTRAWAAGGTSSRTRAEDSAKRSRARSWLGAWMRWVVRLPASVGSRGVRVSLALVELVQLVLLRVGEPWQAREGEGGGGGGERMSLRPAMGRLEVWRRCLSQRMPKVRMPSMVAGGFFVVDGYDGEALGGSGEQAAGVGGAEGTLEVHGGAEGFGAPGLRPGSGGVRTRWRSLR